MSASLPDVAKHLLDRPVFAHVATVMPDGSPQTSPVWIERDGDVVVFNTAYGRTKADNLQRDPRVALSVHDPDDPYSYVQVRGRAELVDEGADATIHRLAQKYWGRDYPLKDTEQRVTVRVTAEAVFVRPGRVG